jgi:hypothetical protein
MRPFQTWDCGDTSCPIKTTEGKRLERVIIWTLDSLGTINSLVSSTKLQEVPIVSTTYKNAVIELIAALEAAQKDPFDQSLHERVWELGEQAVNLLPAEHKLVLLPLIPAFANTVPEMAFCRIVDAWKDYVEKRTGLKYGQHRDKLSAENQCCDDCLNKLRNLFVHGTGFLEADHRGRRRYDKFTALATAASSYPSSGNPILRIPKRICALNDGDIVMLNSLEVRDYIDGVTQLLYALE